MPARERGGRLSLLFINRLATVCFCSRRSLLHTADVIADLLLITLPIRLIYGMTDRALRRRLMFIFSTASASSALSIGLL